MGRYISNDCISKTPRIGGTRLTATAFLAVVVLATAFPSRAFAAPRQAAPPASMPAPDKDDQANRQAMKSLDGRLPEVNFSGNGLGDVIDFLRDLTGANVFMDWKTLNAAGVNKDAGVTVTLKNINFSAALHTILQSVEDPKHPLDFYVEDGIIKITSHDQRAAATAPTSPQVFSSGVYVFAPASQPTGGASDLANQAALKALDQKLPELKFEENGLGDVIRFLQDVTKANIFVNWKALEPAGVTKDTPVIIRLSGTKFSAALHTILQAAEDLKHPLDFFVEDGTIFITTRDALPLKMSQHVYDIRRLLGDPSKHRDQTLIKLITTSIDPDSWTSAARGCTITLADGKLTITQSEENQRCIQNLLTQLEALQD